MYLADDDGQISWSVRDLGDRWRWTPSVVHRFLARLVELKRIVRVPNGSKTGRMLFRLATDEDRPKKKKPPVSPNTHREEFEQIWPAWKSRANNSKKAGFQKYCEQRGKGRTFEQLKKATVAYYRYCEKKGWLGTNSMMHTQTFFGPADRWNANFKEKPLRSQRELPRA